MSEKSDIHIVAKVSGIYESAITVKGENYSVQTEYLGMKSGLIVSHIYLRGEIVHSMKKLCPQDIREKMESKEHYDQQMSIAHHSTVNEYLAMHEEKKIPQDQYCRYIKDELRADNKKAALDIAKEAMHLYPFDIVFQSYFGYLLVCVDNDINGITHCKNALSGAAALSRERKKEVMPLFCLHLGKAYLWLNMRKEAVFAFRKGLEFDRKNHEILKEMKTIGIRDDPPVSFLSRNNPINKYIGKLLYRMSGKNKQQNRPGR